VLIGGVCLILIVAALFLAWDGNAANARQSRLVVANRGDGGERATGRAIMPPVRR
jgi:hypothetical protein